MPYCHSKTPPSYACDAGNKYKIIHQFRQLTFVLYKEGLEHSQLAPLRLSCHQPVDIRIVIESYADGHLGLHIGISQRSGNLELVKLVLQTVKVGKLVALYL